MVREQVAEGSNFHEASTGPRSTLFTTHTPVPAGHDRFEPDRVTSALRQYEGRSTQAGTTSSASGASAQTTTVSRSA